jgi:hypothetical protein
MLGLAPWHSLFAVAACLLKVGVRAEPLYHPETPAVLRQPIENGIT